jgi:hypothetical protein
MLKELIKRFGGTQPHCRSVDVTPSTGAPACEETLPGSSGPRQKNFGRLENGPHRDWRPRLYW